MNSKLAIVIPYFKATYFGETIDSLASQSNLNFKVYIGDDHSPDPPDGMLEKLEQKVEVIYHRFAENLGGTNLVAHWERCLDLVEESSWICILGDDDCLSENFVEEFYQHLDRLESENLDLLKYGVEIINEHSEVTKEIMPEKELSAAAAFTEKFYGEGHSSLSEFVFSKKAYNTYGFRNYPLAWCSDDMAWLDFSEGKIIPVSSKAHVKFRLSPESISGSKHDVKWEAKRQFFRDLVLEKATLFPKKVQLMNLKRFEIFTVKTRNLRGGHFGFFLNRYFKLGRLDECLKFIIRFVVNKIRQ